MGQTRSDTEVSAGTRRRSKSIDGPPTSSPLSPKILTSSPSATPLASAPRSDLAAENEWLKAENHAMKEKMEAMQRQLDEYKEKERKRVEKRAGRSKSADKSSLT